MSGVIPVPPDPQLRRILRLMGTAVAMAIACLAARAQELEPRAYSPSPVGTGFLTVGFGRSSGGVSFDPTVPLTDVHARLYSQVLGLGQTFGLFGRQSLVGPTAERQSSSRLGTTLSVPFTKHQSIKLSYSSGVTARVGANFNTVGLSWQYLWFERH
jgi:hypothetical protein